MTVKRMIIFVLLIALIVSLSGCSLKGDSADDIEARKICNFNKVYANVDVGIGAQDDIFVDTTTGVLYFRNYRARGIGLTPLYNSDGSLKILDGYKKGGSNVQQEARR